MSTIKKHYNKKHNKTQKAKKDTYKDTAFYPPIKAYKSSTLKVSDLHTIYYELYGNPKGKPVLFIHGGPGGGTVPDYARFFNPRKYFIVLVDQRGSGKSKPFGETKQNTTQALISDFEKIRKILNVKRWQLFGGSWGSTLSLAYAIAHPEVVTELVLRGIFTLRKKELDWVQQGPGANFVFPEGWEYYKSVIPKNEQNDFIKAFGKRFSGSMGAKAKDEACLAWSQWEASISHLHPTPHKEIMRDLKKTKNYIPMSLIEYHYFINKGFMPNENYLLDPKNLSKIKKKPMTIVNGRYDMVCPITTAYELHEKMPHARFFATMAGHSMLDKENIKYLVEATNLYAK
jgi:proline iminopeptidase